MQFHTIITHEHPDLDAMLCCYLLKMYGENQYSGIKDARILYCPAGKLPQGKSPAQLEEEGFLTVDIGGGRLDTHPDGNIVQQEKINLAAANLVAKDLGVDTKESLLELLEFTKFHDSSGRSLKSRNPSDHLMALPNLIKGAYHFWGDSFDTINAFFQIIFQAIESSFELNENTFFNEKAHLLTFREDLVFLPPKPSLRTLLASYLMYRYDDIKYQFVSEVSNIEANKYNDLDEVLEKYQIDEKEELKKVVGFITSIKPHRFLLDSKHVLDEKVSFTNIVRGLYHLHGDIEKAIKDVFLLIDFAVSYEKDWQRSIEEYQSKKQIFTIKNAKIVVISATTIAVSKVARWLDKADFIVFRDEKKEHIGLSVNHAGKLRKMKLEGLASKLRTAEIYFNPDCKDEKYKDLCSVGEIADWFLHQSEKLLIHGSPKAHREPSQIPFNIIVELILTEVDHHKKLPDVFCPKDSCLHKKCCFYSLRLNNCFQHRRMCENI